MTRSALLLGPALLSASAQAQVFEAPQWQVWLDADKHVELELG